MGCGGLSCSFAGRMVLQPLLCTSQLVDLQRMRWCTPASLAKPLSADTLAAVLVSCRGTDALGRRSPC